MPVPARALDAAALDEMAEVFHNRHLTTYGHDNRSEPVQIVSIRVAAIGAIAPLKIRDTTAPPGTDARKGTRRAWFRETGLVETAIFERARLAAEWHAPGPLVIESLESTILVPPGWQAKMNADGFVVLTRRPNGTRHP